MSKRNKKVRVPVLSSNGTAARSQNPAVKEASSVHLKYIDDYWELIAAIAYKEYLAHGRGALLFQVEPESEGDWDCIYIPQRRIEVNPMMTNEARLIKEYDPETEVVAIFMAPPASIHSYRGSLVPERLSPRQAYEKVAPAVN